MDFPTIGGWLISAAILAVQVTIVYGFIRLMWVGGGFHIPNPFQPGWGRLHELYGATTATRPMHSTSARIGIVSYGSSIEVGFDAQELVLRKTLFSGALVRIPYAHITVRQAPRRVTVLRIPFRTDGLFSIDGVDILLKSDIASQLITRIPGAAASVAP